MAKDRGRQPEMDYYELRRRREEVLSRRQKQRPEWDPKPVRRAPAKSAAPKPRVNVAEDEKVKQSATGVEVFPPKQKIEKPVQPKQTPLVRKPIQVEIPEEVVETIAPVAEEIPAVEPAPVEIPVMDVEEAPEAVEIAEESVADVQDEAYEEEFGEDVEPIELPEEEPLDENIGNNPFTEFVNLAGNLGGKFGQWKQARAEKATDAPKKRGFKGLFGKKKVEEAPEWDETQADPWAETPGEEADFAFEPEQPAEENTEAFAEMPAEEAVADIAEEAVADVTEEADPVEIPAEEPAADIADIPEEMPADMGEGAENLPEEEFPAEDAFEEAPKPKFMDRIKGLFARKPKAADEDDLLSELDDIDDLEDFDEDIDALQEQLEDDLDADEAPAAEEFAEEPVAEEISGEEFLAEEAPAAEVPAEEPVEVIEEALAEAIADIPEEEMPAEEIADIPEEEISAEEAFDDGEEFDEDVEEAPQPKKGFFARLFSKKEKQDDLLSLLDDDEDDEEDDEDWDEILEDMDEGSNEDMDEKNLIASQMAEGIGERQLSRKERRELAERQAAEAQKAAAPVEEVKKETAAEEQVDEPTRAFTPVRARETAPAFEEDEYDSFDDDEEEEEEAPAPKKRGLFGRKKAKEPDDVDEMLFDDIDEDDEDDDDDDYDDYDDYDDDDDEYDDEDEDDDEGGVFGGIIRALISIIIIVAALIIVLNVLASRNIGPAQQAIDTIGGMLPEAVTDVIFPTYEGDEIITTTPAPTTEASAEATTIPGLPAETAEAAENTNP